MSFPDLSSLRTRLRIPAMPVWLRNLQKFALFSECLLKLHSTFLLQAAGAGRFDLSVVCVSEGEIRDLNRSYRNVDRPTDVLSFPYHEEVGLFSCPKETAITLAPSDNHL